MKLTALTIKQTSFYLLSSNLTGLLLIFSTLILSLPFPFFPIQLLFLQFKKNHLLLLLWLAACLLTSAQAREVALPFAVEPALDAQEIDARTSTGLVYWEGLVSLHDLQGRRLGSGYLEMTGYTAPLRF